MIPTLIYPSYLFWLFSKVFNCDRPTWAVLYTNLWSWPTWAGFGPSWYKATNRVVIPTQINPSYLFWVFSKVFNCDRPTWAVLYTNLLSWPTWAGFGPSWYKLLTVLWFPLKLILVIYFDFLVRFLIVIDQLGLCCTQICWVDQLGLALAQVGISY